MLVCCTRFTLCVLLAGSARAALAEEAAYRLHAGDSVSVSVQSRPDLSGNFRLDERGYITLPLIDPVAVGGRTIAEIRGDVTARLMEVVDGNVQVTVSLDEYRPVYIDGDVVRPGAYPYRPGMTVTIAVALAGGRQSVRSSGTLLNLSREEEEFSELLDTHRANTALEARLLAELNNAQDLVFPADLEEVATGNPRVREIPGLARQNESLERKIAHLEQVIGELESQRTTINSRRDLFNKQLADIESLTVKGVVPKASLLRLQITATSLDQEARNADISIIQSRQSLEETRAQLANLPAEREAEITAALQAVQNSLAHSSIRFDQSQRRMAVLSSQRPPEAEAGAGDTPANVSVTRMGETASAAALLLEAAWDAPVMPGDVIQVPFPDFSAGGALDSSLPSRSPMPRKDVPAQ